MRIDPRRAIVRIIIAGAIGWSVGTVLIARGALLAISVLGGFVSAAAVLLGLVWSLLRTRDASETRRHAAADDPGRNAIFTLLLNGSAVSVIAAIALVR